MAKHSPIVLVRRQVANARLHNVCASSTLGIKALGGYNAPSALYGWPCQFTSVPRERWIWCKGCRVANPFWNRTEQRLRALWRLLIYMVAWRVLLYLLDSWLIPAGQGLAAPALVRTLHYAYYLLSVVGVTWLAARFVDRRSPASLGLALSRRWWAEMAVGLMLGTLLITLIFAAEWALGWLVVTDVWSAPAGQRFFAAILGPIAIFVVIGFAEELIFRGYLLRNCAEGLNGPLHARAALIAALLITSLLFGLYHVFNPNATWASTINLSLAGLMLGLPMVLTGRLAMPIGLHIAWNFAQANLFGFAVSGNNFSAVTLMRTTLTGPQAWTGGMFGPEAGLLGLIAIAIGVAAVWLGLRRIDGSVRLCTALAEYPVHAPATQPRPAALRHNP